MKKIIVGLLIVSGFVFFLFYKGTDESQKAIDFSSLKYKYSKGEERVFNLSQTTEIFFKGQGSSDSNSKFQLKGELIQRIYKVQEDSVVFGAKIKNPMISLEDSTKVSQLKNQLGKEIFVKISPTGKIISFYFPKGHKSEASSILKSIVASMQIILPEATKNNEDLNYQLTELNLNGPIQVEYQISFNNFFQIQKSFIKFDFIGYQDLPDSNIIFLPDSRSFSTLDKGIIKEIDHGEHTIIDSSGLRIESSLKTILSLKKITSFHPSIFPWEGDDFFTAGIIGEEESPAERKEKLKKQIGNLKIENIFESFNQLNFKSQGKDAYDNFRKLKAFLELNPDLIKKVMEQIEFLNPEDPFYENLLSVYFGAISTMEAKFAQEELMNIILKNQDPSVQIQAFGALADLNSPTEKTQEFLIDYYKNPFTPESQSLAALSLGTLAYMGKNNSPSLVKLTSEFLKEELINAKKKEDILTLISAIGNSGDANLIDCLRPFMASKEKDISTSAVIALENMNGDKVNNIIKELLNNPNLKSSALYVLFKAPESKFRLDLAKSFFEGEQNNETDLKMQSLRIISTNSKFFKKEVVEFLEKVKSKDPNPKIRNAALDLLISL